MEKEVEIYDFTLEAMKPFAGKSGIYGLIYDNQVFYVGQSKNLYERLKKHQSPGAFNTVLKQIIKEEGKCNRCKSLAMYNFIAEHRENIGFIILRETNDLDGWEEHYIFLFQPKFNYIGVDVPYKRTDERQTA